MANKAILPARSKRDDYQVRSKAMHFYRCEGDGGKSLATFAPGCSRTIERGTPYVARVVLAPSDRATPRRYEDVARFCVTCSLAFNPHIVATEAVQ